MDQKRSCEPKMIFAQSVRRCFRPCWFEAALGSPREGYNPDHLLDSTMLGKELQVRNWRAGDRFWPAHTKEPKKIKELLQDRHITGEEKRGWPVIASGDEVVWMRGFGVRRDFRAKNGGGVLIREFPINGE